jgi:hypothetical protein
MFCGCHAFNQRLNGWNVGNVTFMRDIFCDALSFTIDLVPSRFDFAREFYASNWHHHPTNAKRPRSPEIIGFELNELQEKKRKLEEEISELQQEKASGILRRCLTENIPKMRMWPYRPPGAFGNFDFGGHEFRSAEERWNETNR